jgi:hypothetical protein
VLREHRPVFGTAHIGLLVTVAWASGRDALQRECIEHNWSKNELLAVIKLRFGSRRQGGRRRRLGTDEAGLLVQLADMAETWRRWHNCASAAGEQGGEAALDRLPEAVRKEVRTVAKAIVKLRDVVDGELARLRDGGSTAPIQPQ